MSAFDLLRYLDWFQSYIQEFYCGTKEDVANIDLKKDHSLRVLREAQMLTASLQVDSPLADIVHITALFHDVGRFPQYRQFKTYNDRKSLDHARAGVTVMRGTDILHRVLPEDRKVLLGNIFFTTALFFPLGSLRHNL